ncbi:MAG TPA: hypothetical protein ENH84_06840 [Phycisphaerae bacterium]|nr:hypothetical protein [Phycisphaerae bacterium]
MMRFFLIDKITRWDVGTGAEAMKNVALSEDFFDDHFPRRPVMPGVLIIEGMAQIRAMLRCLGTVVRWTPIVSPIRILPV